jgi:uridine kinase
MHADILRFVRSQVRQTALPTRIIAIDGCGGAGKSTLAAELGRGLPAPIVHTDDFASWESPLDWSGRFTREVLEPAAHGDVVRFQRYDWNEQHLGDWIELEPAAELIIEGVGSSRLAFAGYVDLSIWVETSRAERLRRGLERDGNAMAAHWARWMAAEDAYVAAENPAGRADLTVSGEG